MAAECCLAAEPTVKDHLQLPGLFVAGIRQTGSECRSRIPNKPSSQISVRQGSDIEGYMHSNKIFPPSGFQL